MALVNVQKRIRKAAAKLGLAPGEEIRGACTTNPTGSVTRMAIGAGVGGAVGAATAAAVTMDAPPHSTGGMADAYPEGQMFLAVTSQRVIVCPVAQMSGKPKEIAAEWPIEDVAGIAVEKGKLAHPTTIRFSDGSAAMVEAARGSGAEKVATLFA
ncbi:MAG: hypothetical protein ACERLM_14125 [Acidimicrobiales bacterium]